MKTLQEVLPSNVFSGLLNKVQEEEVKQAGIENLVSCPFCSFATIMEDENDKVLRCQNPECLKESCR
jgi:TRIAD3 protein (E3 ubiquitin-protein ligase RNF216)